MASAAPILVLIDDETAFVEVLADLLSDGGYRVVTAGTGAAGVEMVQQCSPPPCAILLDLGLPDMNGLEVLKRLKLDLETTAVPIVLLSGYSTTGADHPLAAAVLTKPVKIDEVLRTLVSVRHA